MSLDKDLTYSDNCTRELGINPIETAHPQIRNTPKSASFSSSLTHTLKWAQDKQILSIENTTHQKVSSNRLSHSHEFRDDFVNERKLRGFFSKITKAAGKDVLGNGADMLKHTQSEINQWITAGYTTLQSLIPNGKDFPWDQISSIKHPVLMEQLITLYHILKNPPFNSAPYPSEFILRQALILARQANSPFDQTELVNQSLEISFCELAKLIFAADRAPVTLIERIKHFQGNGLSGWLDDNVRGVIEQSKNKILHVHQKHVHSGIQPPELAKRNKLINEVSEIILLKDGTVNSGLIHKVCNELVGSDIELNLRLNLLQNSPKLRSMLNSINPATLYAPLVNNALEEYSTKRNASFTVLTAFLSHLRQGNEGSCFATFLAINMLASRPLECAEDLIELMQNGYLTKHCEGISIQFPFVPTHYTESIAKPILVTPEGQSLLPNGNKPFLWESPGLQAAAAAMQIKDLKEAVQNYLKKIATPAVTPRPLTVKPLQIILALHESSEIQNIGIKAFEREEVSPLLLAWVNSIAGMAEANDSGLLKSTLVVTVLAVIIEKIKSNNPPFPKPLIELFNVYLNEELNRSLRFLYDRSVDNESVSNDQHSKKGGFILYDRGFSSSPNDWNKIDSPELFNEMIKQLVEKVLKSIKEQGSVRLIQWIDDFSQKTLALFNDDFFLNETIKNINVRNNRLNNPLEYASDLKFTPWLIRGGNNPKKTLQVYLERNELPSIEKFTPLSAPNLLQKVIQLGQACSEHNHDQIGTNPYLITPVRTQGLHSFSLMLGHPTLLKGLEKGSDPNLWLQECVIKPGKSIAQSAITPTMKRELIDFCLKKILPANYTQTFLDKYLAIPTCVTVKEFRYHLKGILQEIHPSLRGLSLWMRKIDTCIYNCLSVEQKTHLENSAVHFADTNWYEGAHDVHFCFVINPGNGKLEIWEAMDNGKNLSAADQMAWLQDHEWEIYEPFFLDKENPHVKK